MALKEADVIADITAAQRRVEAADQLADLLAAASEAFVALRSGCRACEEHGGELFASFAFAAALAEQGKLALVAAPSLRAGLGAGAGPGLSVQDDLGVVADALAELGGALDDALTAAARVAGQAEDQAACAQAAAEAADLHRLLAWGGP
jgi:hypothetical protein